MAVTTQKSAQTTAQDAGGLANQQSARAVRADLEVIPFAFTQTGTGDQNSIAALCYLPAGRRRVFLSLSTVDYSAVASGQIDIGHTGYTQPDGTVVAANAAALADNMAITSAGRATLTGAGAFFDYDAKEPVLVQALYVGSGGAAAGHTLNGVLMVSKR